MTTYDIIENGTVTLQIEAEDIFSAARRYVDENHPEHKGAPLYMEANAVPPTLKVRVTGTQIRLFVRLARTQPITR